VAGRPELVWYDFLQARAASMKVFVSFRDACWNPRSSQSSLTEGTLLSDTEGFDGDIMGEEALVKRAGLCEHRNKDEKAERGKDQKTKVR
jgi:hypothetical protein